MDEKKQKRNLKFEKAILIFFTLGAIIGLVGMLYSAGVLLDNNNDESVCEKEMFAAMQLNESTDSVECFANDDFFVINFGRSIHCDCFYDTQHLFGLMSFVSGVEDEN